jgi:hypothetical protein
MAFALRMGPQEAERHVTDLVGRGLIDCVEDTLSPHNWSARQYKSDADTTAAERQRRKRQRDSHGDVTRDVTDVSRPPETEAETEQKQSRAEADRALAEEILKDVGFRVDNFEDGFLQSLVNLETWSKKQRQKFDLIALRYRQRGSGKDADPLFQGPRPTVSNGKVYVKIQTPAWDAWGEWWLKKYKVSPPVDSTGNGFWFETEFPPEATQ